MNSHQPPESPTAEGTQSTDRDWNQIFAALRAPFSSDVISFRIGARMRDKTRGQALPYIDRIAVQNRLDDAVGPAFWKNDFVAAPNGGGVMCVLSFKIDGEWIGKSDVAQQDAVGSSGADRSDGGGQDSSQKFEMAVKGAASDAFKRAAVLWGIGRYLSSYDAEWVELKNDGRQFKDAPRLPASMLPPGDRGARGASSHSYPRQGTSSGPAGGSGEPARPVKAAEPASASRSPPAQSGASPTAAPSSPRPAAPERPSAPSPAGSVPAAEKSASSGGSMMSQEQWNSLPEETKKHVRLLKQRIEQRLALPSVEEYIKTGKGKDYPEWLKTMLLEKLRQAKSTPETEPQQHAAA